MTSRLGLCATVATVLSVSVCLVGVPAVLAGAPDRPAMLRPSERWSRQFGDALDDWATDVTVDRRGNSYVVGTYYLGDGGFRAFIRSYDQGGSLRWVHPYHAEHENLGTGVAVDGRGSVALVGQSRDDTARDSDAFIRTFTVNGEAGWTRRFGSERDDTPEDVAVDGDGNVYIVGRTKGALGREAPVGSSDVFIRVYDAAGRLRWTRQFGTTGQDVAEGVGLDGAGNVYIVGWTRGALPGETNAGRTDVLIRVYDGAGQPRRTQQFGSPSADVALGVAVAGDGSFCVVGSSGGGLPGQPSTDHGDAFVRCYDEQGRLRWTRRGAGQARAVALDADGSVIVAGETWPTAGAAVGEPRGDQPARPMPAQTVCESEVFVRAYGPEGARLWGHVFGGPGCDTANAVARGRRGAILVAGAVQGPALPGQKPQGGRDAFLRLYR
jgi:hypothetical protein